MDIQVDGCSHGAAYSDLVLHQMLKEMSVVCAQLDNSVQAEWVIKRVQFLAYELRAQMPLETSPRETCEHLNQFFFEKKGFTAVPKPTDLNDFAPCFLLHKVLQTRSGAPSVLSLIYAFLGCQIGLQLEFVDLRPTLLLKYVEKGVSHFIDVTRKGRILESDDLLESLHARFNVLAVPASALLDPLSCESFMTQYLTSLKFAYVKLGEPEPLLAIQNALLAHQPSNLQLLGERALLYRRMGHFKNALADLKRYFSFNDRKQAPSELVRVFDELVTMVEKQKTTIQIID